MTPLVPFKSTTTSYRNTRFFQFRVGTCHGLWRVTDDAYEVLAVVNTKKGNGHFKAAMQWFERSCRRDSKLLRLCEVFNPWLYYVSVRWYGYKRRKRTLFTLEKSFA